MRPIFIVGCDRSGTTLLASMLGRAEDVIVTPESQFLINCLIANSSESPADLIASVEGSVRYKIWGLQTDMELQDISTISRTKTDNIRAVMQSIVKAYQEENGVSSSNTWVDHTPTHVNYVQRLIEVFPEAKFIHIYRDGRAVAASVMPLVWGPNTILSAAHWWKRNVSMAYAAEYALAADNRFMHLRYEKLVVAPAEVLPKVCAFCAIDYSANMEEGGGFRVPNFTRHQHRDVNGKLNAKRIDAWQDSLTPRQIEIFENLTGDTLRYLGYELKFGNKARSPTRGEQLISEIKELLIGQYNSARNLIRYRRVHREHAIRRRSA